MGAAPWFPGTLLASELPSVEAEVGGQLPGARCSSVRGRGAEWCLQVRAGIRAPLLKLDR